MATTMTQPEFEAFTRGLTLAANRVEGEERASLVSAFRSLLWELDEVRARLGAEAHVFPGRFDRYHIWLRNGIVFVHGATRMGTLLYVGEDTTADDAWSAFLDFRVTMLGTSDPDEQRVRTLVRLRR